jgi:hypothetical protein
VFQWLRTTYGGHSWSAKPNSTMPSHILGPLFLVNAPTRTLHYTKSSNNSNMWMLLWVWFSLVVFIMDEHIGWKTTNNTLLQKTTWVSTITKLSHKGTHTSLHLALSFVLEGVNLVWKMWLLFIEQISHCFLSKCPWQHFGLTYQVVVL